MLKKYPLALYLTWLVILFLLPLPLVLAFNNGLLDSQRNLLIYDAGIIAYVWWLAIVWLSTRPQWLDWRIGLPAMYFIHGLLGILALGLASIHMLYAFSMDDLIKNVGKIAWYLAIFNILYASFFLSGWLVDRWHLAAKTKQKLQFIFKHQVSVWLHRLNFVVIGLIWFHVNLIGRVNRLTDFMILFDLYTVLALGSYCWKKFVASAAPRLTGQLVSKQNLNIKVYQLKIKLAQKAPAYHAGDFYFLSFQGVPGLTKEAHPFSVASTPNLATNEVTFTIQSRGDFTRRLRSVPMGTIVKLEGPFGRFAPIIEQMEPKIPLVLIGMGTGIAPLLSLAQQYAPTRQIHVIWTAHESTDFYYESDFIDLTPQITYHQHQTRLSIAEYQAILSTQERQEACFFIVGPASGVLGTEKTLRQLGISAKRLIDERLTM